MKNALYKGDCREVMLRLPLRSFTLAYLDPPFCTKRIHRMPDGKVAFDDRWRDLESYLATLREVCLRARLLLADAGSLVLHVDSKTSHYAKVMLDEVFGADHFASEIVWRYRRWPSKTPNFQRVHDTLLRYRKSLKVPPRFHQLYEPAATSTVAQWGTTKQRALVDKEGRRTRSSRTETESPGVPLGDVWDVSIIAPVSHERTGFPTQKPEALLERLVLSLTNPKDRVLDPYVGSGTTLAVCSRLKRRGVGIDSSSAAIRVAKKRLGLKEVL